MITREHVEVGLLSMNGYRDMCVWCVKVKVKCMGSLVSYTTLEAYSGVRLLKPEPRSQVPDPPGFLVFVIRAVRFLEASKRQPRSTPNPYPLKQ